MIKIVATRCHRLKLKCTKFDQLGLRLRPLWGSLQLSPHHVAGFKGPTSKGKEEKGREGKWKGREGRHSLAPSTFGLVYATPLLEHQAQFGLNPAMTALSNCFGESLRNAISQTLLRSKPT